MSECGGVTEAQKAAVCQAGAAGWSWESAEEWGRGRGLACLGSGWQRVESSQQSPRAAWSRPDAAAQRGATQKHTP